MKVTALTAIREISKKEQDKNVWLLDSAGFSQYQIESILDIDQSAISRILNRKAGKKKDNKKKTTEA
jgi:predicted transcriptional regulator